MTPPQSLGQGSSNCGWDFYPPTEPGRQVFGCAPIYVNCNACNLDGTPNGATPQSMVVELQWVVPNAVTSSHGTHTYNFTVVHEAGAHPQVSLTISTASGQPLTSASPDNPPLQATKGTIQYTNKSMTTDQSISLRYY